MQTIHHKNLISNPYQLVSLYLQAWYYIDITLANRYAKVIVDRAVLQYLKDIDTPMITEDLYQEEEKFVNLEFSEQDNSSEMQEEASRAINELKERHQY